MPRASICKRRIETCARGMRWVRPLRASTEVEPLRAGPATNSPSPEAASMAHMGLASKRGWRTRLATFPNPHHCGAVIARERAALRVMPLSR